MKIEELSLEEKIGQLFMIGLENKSEEDIKKLIENKKIGGIVLYKNNYNSYKEMVEFINKLKIINKNNKVPIFISIDQEGGRVNRIPLDIKNLKSATKVSKTEDIEIIQETGRIIGEILNKTGISMNYAPVLDIRRFQENHAIGDRCYGKTKEEVIKYAIEVMKEEQKQNVIATVKHFPGHGLTKKDSHFHIPKIIQKMDELENGDMLPFEEAIKQGADSIMVGHLIIKDIEKKYPASLSKKIIREYLIEKYNFKGLIITDDLKMMAIRLHYNMKKAVVKAIEAGNDIVMIGMSRKKIEIIIKYIIKKIKQGKLEEKRIDESVEKILKIKEKYNINDEKVEGINIEEINKRIENINSKII